MLLGWLPIVGPIIEGIVSIFKARTDQNIVQINANKDVEISAMQRVNEITLAFQNDISVRIARDLVMFPGSVWCGLYIWDKIVVHRYPGLVWTVYPLDGNMAYLPYALMAFYFGSAWLYRK